MSFAPRHTWHGACAAAILALAAFAGCGAPSAPLPTKAGVVAPPPIVAASATATAVVDICVGSPKLPHPYHGILRKARCDQDMFITMAGVADALGTDCRNCHVPLVVGGKEDPKKEDYPVMTDRKVIANWMSAHLMESLKTVSGEPMKCKLCHVDEKGRPIRRIFGVPRDLNLAHEWMSAVMMTKFVAADGSRLKCKTCHMDNFGQPNWQGKVILTDHLPAHATP